MCRRNGRFPVNRELETAPDPRQRVPVTRSTFVHDHRPETFSSSGTMHTLYTVRVTPVCAVLPPSNRPRPRTCVSTRTRTRAHALVRNRGNTGNEVTPKSFRETKRDRHSTVPPRRNRYQEFLFPRLRNFRSLPPSPTRFLRLNFLRHRPTERERWLRELQRPARP